MTRPPDAQTPRWDKLHDDLCESIAVDIGVGEMHSPCSCEIRWYQRELSAERERKEQTPAQLYAKADINDDEAFLKAKEENDAYVGALEYKGNTVSYSVQKGKNYGNKLLEAHRLSGAKSGQHLHERIIELMAERERGRRVREETIEECAKECEHRAFLCHAHNEHGRGMERGMLDAAVYVRALARAESAPEGGKDK